MRYGSREPELLFHKHDIFQVVESHRAGAVQLVRNMDGDRLLNTPTDDLVQYAVEKFAFDLPQLLTDQAHVDQREDDVEVHDFGRIIRVKGTVVELTIPFTGDKDFFFIRPTTFNLNPPRAIVSDQSLIIHVKGRGLTKEQVQSGLQRTIAEVQQYLDWQKPSAAELARSLPEITRNEIETRKAKLLKDRDLVAGLGFAMKERPGASRTYVAPEVRRKVEPKLPPASTAPYKPEPTLDDAQYGHILTVMGNMGTMLERSPSAFVGMGEEHLRDHFLVQLNGHFEGNATGETFNKSGKTDIIIRSEGRSIFIAECKFWGGEKLFLETIDQLLGYLTWRDTKTALVIFNRNKDFSAVVTKAREAIKTHPNYKRGPLEETETTGRYVLKQRDDPARETMITLMLFDVPVSE